MKLSRLMVVPIMLGACASAQAAIDVSSIPEALRPSVQATFASIMADEATLDVLRKDHAVVEKHRAFPLLAEALEERMHFHFGQSDRAAARCIAVAAAQRDDMVAEQCGLLRLALARIDLRMGDMERRAEEIQGIIDRATALQGKTRAQLNLDPDASYQWSLDHFESIKGLPPATVNRRAQLPVEIPFQYVDSAAPLAGLPRVHLSINGQDVLAALDTGSYFSTLPQGLARTLGVRQTEFREPITDLTGETRLHQTAIADSLRVADVTISNFPFLIGEETAGQSSSYISQVPILGLDALLFLRRYEVTKGSLRLFPESRQCTSKALLSGEMDPTISEVFLLTETNHGKLTTLFDTGLDRFATASYLHRDAYGISEMPASSGTVVSIGVYRGIAEKSFEFPLSIQIGARQLDEQVRMDTAIQQPSQLQLGSPSLDNLSYYFDLNQGVACELIPGK